MRLRSNEIQGILKVSKRIVPESTVFLYGSRTDDKKKGGDIDLLFVVPDIFHVISDAI